MSRSAGQIAAITAATALTGIVGYAVYFDYMRRNSADFRKGLSTSWFCSQCVDGTRLEGDETGGLAYRSKS